MCLLPTMQKIIEYANGGAIYLSSIHPIVYETQELQNECIDVVISLLEEREKPDIFGEIHDLKIKHYYYQCLDSPDFDIMSIHKHTFNTIYKSVDYGRRILIHCRSGMNYSVLVLIAFFLKILHFDQQYLIYNFAYSIPKSRQNWTDSFLNFITVYYPQAKPDTNQMEKLYLFEEKLNQPVLSAQKLFTFKPLTSWSSE